MNKRNKIAITISSLIILCAWTSKETNDIKKAEWLIGTWQNNTSKGIIYEKWHKLNDTELLGKSFILKEKDTIVFENIRLLIEKDSLFYIPTVKNQNQNLPVRFKCKLFSETEMIFENLHHDFPQIISYSKITNDSLVAEISGTKNGQPKKQIFAMKRVQ